MKVALRASLLAVVIALPAAADAPTDQYAFFTQETQTIHDKLTGLTWERGVGVRLPIDQALQHCKTLSTTFSLPMRLPSLKELLTIVDEEPHREYDDVLAQVVQKYIDRAAFPRTPSGPFWTSSTFVSTPTRYRTVDFSDGSTGDLDNGNNAFVRCVSSQ